MTDPHLTDPMQLRLALILWDKHHLNTLEIARRLGVSEATVYNTLAHHPRNRKGPGSLGTTGA